MVCPGKEEAIDSFLNFQMQHLLAAMTQCLWHALLMVALTLAFYTLIILVSHYLP